jgi:hypothetical protein
VCEPFRPKWKSWARSALPRDVNQVYLGALDDWIHQYNGAPIVTKIRKLRARIGFSTPRRVRKGVGGQHYS